MTTHVYKGVQTGNPYQKPGKHRYGITLIPMGDRQRDAFEYGENVLEERDSIDAYDKYRKK